jgi:mono/diheme cytochrome c family protein
MSPLPSQGGDAVADAGPVGAADAAGAVGRSDAGAEAASAATFASLYASIFVPSCSGGSCHDPGSQHGVSFVSQMTGYDSVRGMVTPRNAPGSELYTVLASGRMPPNGPMLSPDQLAAIASWIDAGASND